MEDLREQLKTDIVEFIDTYLRDNDIVVGVLRYGSHLPHVYQKTCLERGNKPKRIPLVLSHMLSFFPSSFFPNKDFFILDDTIFEGVVMQEKLSQILNLGATAGRVKSAALIAHELSQFEPDFPKPIRKMRDAKYIAWKEELAFVVRQDIRPTERDHPLYYLRGENMELGQLLSLIEDYGKLHPVGSDWTAPVFRASLTVDSSILADVAKLPGIDIDRVAKVRFYWQKPALPNLTKVDEIPSSNAGYQITIAPIVFVSLDIDTFVDQSESLADLLGLSQDFFKNIRESHSNEMVFYFATRSIAALLLHRLLNQISPSLHQYKCNMRVVSPELVDGHVNYIFPDEYHEFYGVVTSQIERKLETDLAPSILPWGDRWKLPECQPIAPQPGRLLPDIYRLLEFLSRDLDPAQWDGKRWVPRKTTKGVSFAEILTEFKDVCFVSAALDELLDSGLIRARDYQRHSDHKTIREFLSGGEYKALQVSRIADTWRFEVPAVDPTIAEAEARDLWGTD